MKNLKNLLGSLIPSNQSSRRSRIMRDIRRDSLCGFLQHVKQVSLKINTIIDVGVADGTTCLYEFYPDSRIILIEPLVEFKEDLERVSNTYSNCEYILAAAFSSTRPITVNVHPDLVGSSIYKEPEDSNVNGYERVVPAITLDNVCASRKTKGNYLIKIDAQGAELEILKGAEKIINETEIIIQEVSFFGFFEGGPKFFECVEYLKERGFVPYDIFNLNYRLLDGAMAQVDMAFVPEESILRKFHNYANREQRNNLNKTFLSLYQNS